MAGQRGLAVAGTHGKSTTAAMTAHILVARGTGSDGRRRRRSAGGPIGRAFRTRRPGAGRGLRISRQFPPPAAATRRHPGHRARSFRLLRFAGQLGAGIRRVRRAGCRTTACCWSATIARPAAASGGAARLPQGNLRPSTRRCADWSARNLSARAGRYRFEIHHRRQAAGHGRVAGCRPAQRAQRPGRRGPEPGRRGRAGRTSSAGWAAFPGCSGGWRCWATAAAWCWWTTTPIIPPR